MTKRISLEKIIKIVDKAYNPDEQLVLRAFKGEKVGDGLAEFLARELKDTYDPKSKNHLEEAIRAIQSIKNQMTTVAYAIIDQI